MYSHGSTLHHQNDKDVELENIAKRLKEASKPSTSTKGMISEVLKILEFKNIADRIKVSKPSTSSTQITTIEMVKFIDICLIMYRIIPLVKVIKIRDFNEVIKIKDFNEVIKMYVLDFVNALQEDLKETPLGHEEIRCLENGLYNLSKFYRDIKYTITPLKEFSSLQSLIEALAFEATFVMIYSYEKDLHFVL
ncbi:hypothetical protein KY290_007536 [Solanum tuberosum]|uniref:Uncharacterized protein n=1 Tax=Solanum tuberosum TaxID=4113 RepID=A0ABQ7W5W9_SOLTU|nr:hypothetical protein KY290_007536 [Solanum tuberosum]